jgi:transposase
MSYDGGMAKRKFELTMSQLKELIQTYTQCNDGVLRTRYQAVRMYGTRYPVEEICALTRCSRTSLMEWCRAYQSHGVAGLRDGRLGGNSAKLTPAQREDLLQRLETYTPHQLFGSVAHTPTGQFWTVEDLQQAVAQWYGVQYASRTSYSKLFHMSGLSYQRPARVFKSQRVPQIMEFEENTEKN